MPKLRRSSSAQQACIADAVLIDHAYMQTYRQIRNTTTQLATHQSESYVDPPLRPRTHLQTFRQLLNTFQTTPQPTANLIAPSNPLPSKCDTVLQTTRQQCIIMVQLSEHSTMSHVPFTMPLVLEP